MKNNKFDEYDDGHSIVDMSSIERPNLFTFRNTKQEEVKQEEKPWVDNTLNKDERRWAILGALKASILIALAYIVGLGLVVLLLVLYFKR